MKQMIWGHSHQIPKKYPLFVLWLSIRLKVLGFFICSFHTQLEVEPSFPKVTRWYKGSAWWRKYWLRSRSKYISLHLCLFVLKRTDNGMGTCGWGRMSEKMLKHGFHFSLKIFIYLEIYLKELVCCFWCKQVVTWLKILFHTKFVITQFKRFSVKQ